MEESVSGFKQRGTWGDVVEHGERIVRALRDAGVDGAALEAFDEWRPKAHERIDEEVSEKTADQASVGEGAGERAGKTPDEDLQTAGDRLSASYEAIGDGDDEGAVESWQDSIEYAKRAVDTAGRRALRKVEDTVYRRVMTQFAPYYFDNDLVSANVRRQRSQGEFVFEVNINDDDLKAEVGAFLEQYRDDLSRWHVDTERNTETAELAEGAEAPESAGDAEPTSN